MLDVGELVMVTPISMSFLDVVELVMVISTSISSSSRR
jgi:hypothetical protein